MPAGLPRGRGEARGAHEERAGEPAGHPGARDGEKCGFTGDSCHPFGSHPLSVLQPDPATGEVVFQPVRAGCPPAQQEEGQSSAADGDAQ